MMLCGHIWPHPPAHSSVNMTTPTLHPSTPLPRLWVYCTLYSSLLSLCSTWTCYFSGIPLPCGDSLFPFLPLSPLSLPLCSPLHPHPPQLREPLPLVVLRQESCPRISAHDVITLCQLEYHALGYGGGARESDSTPSLANHTNPLLRRVKSERKGRGGKGGRKGQRGVLVDIRSQEEYPIVMMYISR